MAKLDQTRTVPTNDAAGDQLVAVVPVENRILFEPSFDVITPDDITIVFCVRLHEGNPWIVDRLAMMANYYDPCPAIVIVDFGSEPEKAAIVRQVCDLHGYKYHYVDDTGVFSLAAGRNAAFEQTNTDFVFFCDPDFVSERDLFSRLAKNASALNMRNVVDIILNPPAFHLRQSDTEVFEGLSGQPEQQSSFLRFLSFKENYTETSRESGKFVAPYSNVFLINRRMFSMVGGYDTNFRGHGSEDFEFLLRLAIHTGHLPLPDSASEDCFSPLHPTFYEARSYQGFRRLFELMSQPTESLGIKVFHLDHLRERSSDWYGNNDWRRERFKTSTDPYLKDHANLLSVDYLSRSKRIACLCKNLNTWGYFLPLRLAGYEVVPVLDDSPETLKRVADQLEAGEISDIAIFNPYMKSHAAFKGLILLARELNRKVIVIERGALPNTIYYDDDVSYVSDGYTEESFSQASFDKAELSRAADYIAELRKGASTLESMDSYEKTSAKYSAYAKLSSKKIVFIPLQLDDDMAVTMFIKGDQPYADFVSTLPALMAKHSDVLFIVKPHPLSKLENVVPTSNVVIADRSDNIHFLLDLAAGTLCYNSGVGLLSLMHSTPTITLGNAFYNIKGVGYRARSSDEGLNKFLSGEVPVPDHEMVNRLAAWFTQRKYSEFIATDDIREFKTRKAHGYKDILVTKFRWNGHAFDLGRVKQIAPFSWKSYAASRIAPTPKSTASVQEAPKFYRWGINDFNRGEYAKSADYLLLAHKLGYKKGHLLRFAAEAAFKAGNRLQAVSLLQQARKENPGVASIRLRMLVMLFPPMKFIIGDRAMDVPKTLK